MGRRIAIVEDDPRIRANYSDALTRHGYEVSAYANRRDAEAAFATRAPELAIIDIGLGAEVDGGLELCRRLRALSSTVPIAPREIRYSGPGRPIRLSGVPDLIAQMLDKLVENACEYATPGTPVEIILQDADNDVTLRVRNLGAALPPDMQDRLFESMVTVKSGAVSDVPHLGLGLYIVKLIARFHHGTAGAANRDDAPGVEVTVRLARYVSDPAAPRFLAGDEVPAGACGSRTAGNRAFPA